MLPATNELSRLGIKSALGEDFLPVNPGDVVFAPNIIQHRPYLVFRQEMLTRLSPDNSFAFQGFGLF